MTSSSNIWNILLGTDSRIIDCVHNAVEYFVSELGSHGDLDPFRDESIISMITLYVSRLQTINELSNLSYVDISTINVLVRSLFEYSVYLKYIFSDPQKWFKRSRAYAFSQYQDVAYYFKYSKGTTVSVDEFTSQLIYNYTDPLKYISDFRSWYADCFDGLPSKYLDFKSFDVSKFKSSKLDDLSWYNDTFKDNRFVDLVLRLKEFNDDYIRIYVPCCRDVHAKSSGLVMVKDDKGSNDHEISISPSWAPTIFGLSFARWQCVEFIKYINSVFKSSQKRLVELSSACLNYVEKNNQLVFEQTKILKQALDDEIDNNKQEDKK